MTQDKAVKVYDYNGVIVNVEGFRQWFRENNPELWHQYKVVGLTNPEVLRAVTPQVQALYEQATLDGVYPVSLIPHVQERLARDSVQGYGRVLFTSVPRAVTEKQIKELGLAPSIDVLLTLVDIQATFGLADAVKEDPVIFRSLTDYLTQKGMGEITSYTDDMEKRVLSAVKAHCQLVAEGREGIGSIYYFDQKFGPEKISCEGYQKVNNLLLVE